MNIRLVNQDPNCHEVVLGDVTLLFSYSTCVAYYAPNQGWVASENVWSQTTGKHLNRHTPIDRKDRTPREEFERQLEHLLRSLHWSATSAAPPEQTADQAVAEALRNVEELS